MNEKPVEAIERDIKEFNKLKKIAQSADFEEYRNLVLDMTAKKMFNAFMPNTIKDWGDFDRTRAEITALLLPLQEIVSADAHAKRLREQLDGYYKN